MKRRILFFVLPFIFNSCSGQGNTLKSSNSDEDSSHIGTSVSEIDSTIWPIFQTKDGNYWFGTKKKGVYFYNGKSLSRFTEQDGLCSSNILSVQEDKFGNVYFDTPEGVSKFDGKKFTTLKIKEDPEWKSTTGDLWFRMGWDSNGPYRFDGTYLHHIPFPKNDQEEIFRKKYPNVSFNPYGIYSIYNDSKGNVWFGTSSLGLYKWDGKEISWMYEQHLTETPQGGAFGIRSIIEDSEGYIWICTPLYKYKVNTTNLKGSMVAKIDYHREPGASYPVSDSLYFMSMALDDHGNIWMATYNNGVWRNDGQELKHYPIKKGGQNVELFSIYKDKKGTLWLGTQTDGAYRFNGESFVKFTF